MMNIQRYLSMETWAFLTWWSSAPLKRANCGCRMWICSCWCRILTRICWESGFRLSQAGLRAIALKGRWFTGAGRSQVYLVGKFTRNRWIFAVASVRRMFGTARVWRRRCRCKLRIYSDRSTCIRISLRRSFGSWLVSRLLLARAGRETGNIPRFLAAKSSFF